MPLPAESQPLSKLLPTEKRPGTSEDSDTSSFRRPTPSVDVKLDSGLAPSPATAGQISTSDTLSVAEPEPHSLGFDHDARNVPSIAVNDQVQRPSEEATSQHLRPHTPSSFYPSARHSVTSDKRDPQETSHEVETQHPRPRTPSSFYSNRTHSVTSENRDPQNSTSSPLDGFRYLSTHIETGALDDPFSSNQTSFSKRGSMLLDGQQSVARLAPDSFQNQNHKNDPGGLMPIKEQSALQRTLSTTEKELSQQILSLYEGDKEKQGLGILSEEAALEHGEKGLEATLSTNGVHAEREGSNPGRLGPWEAAGGLEDWRDVNSAEVDRYGFIKKQPKPSDSSSRLQTPSNGSPEQKGHDRGNDNRLSSPEEGSAKHRKLQRPPPDSSRSHRFSTIARSTRSAASSRPPSRTPSRVSAVNSAALSTRSRLSLNPFTSTPNKHRRWADEAPNMLLPDPKSSASASPAPHPNIQTERARTEKWRKMADNAGSPSSTSRTALGGGQQHHFDLSHRKLEDRVWKGIPEAWRAQAWQDFLQPPHGSETDADLAARYRQHKAEPCADDQQIHLDVPRTAGDHLLFRVECRGGQRLLFHVLRALALEFPATGYTQGMAPVAATLLIYMREEDAFASAFRLWKYRGLAELFAPGFENLRNTVRVFEEQWLARSPVRAQLESLGIDPMMYGMRWYLTMFNYALPFEVLMRVWDVFMFYSGGARGHGGEGRFDVLHAVATALIDGLAGVVAEGEFETVLETLTKPVRVENADVLMRVARKEFEAKRRG